MGQSKEDIAAAWTSACMINRLVLQLVDLMSTGIKDDDWHDAPPKVQESIAHMAMYMIGNPRAELGVMTIDDKSKSVAMFSRELFKVLPRIVYKVICEAEPDDRILEYVDTFVCQCDDCKAERERAAASIN